MRDETVLNPEQLIPGRDVRAACPICEQEGRTKYWYEQLCAAPVPAEIPRTRGHGQTRPHSAPVVVTQLPPANLQPCGRGPVEAAVQEEANGMAAETRTGLVAIALARARILDSSRVASAQPAAAKVLVSVMDTLHKGSAQGRRGNLALVRTMTEKG
jgi:hypothetical protein